MRLQALLALLTMSTLAFAGCAGDNGEPETQDDHEDDHDDEQPSATQTTTQAATTTTSGSATSTTSGTQAPANSPPTGSISAAVNGTAVTFTLTGSDPDGDTIAWDLEFGDGETTSGTTLPATVEHTYAEGNFTASFTITDGKDPVTYEAAFEVAIAGGSGPVQVVNAGWQIGSSDAGAFLEFFACEAGPGDGVTHAVFTVEPQSFLVPFVATISDASGGAAIQGWTISVSDPGCGVEDYTTFSVEGAGPITGEVPDGYSFAFVYSDGGVMPEVTITFG